MSVRVFPEEVNSPISGPSEDRPVQCGGQHLGRCGADHGTSRPPQSGKPIPMIDLLVHTHRHPAGHASLDSPEWPVMCMCHVLCTHSYILCIQSASMLLPPFTIVHRAAVNSVDTCLSPCFQFLWECLVIVFQAGIGSEQSCED